MASNWNIPGFRKVSRQSFGGKEVRVISEKHRLPAHLIPKGVKPKEYIKQMKKLLRESGHHI